jgi:lysozyme
LNAIGEKIDKLVTVKLTKNQREALEDFVLNMGIRTFANSNMLKKLNAGDYDAVPKEMMKWTAVGGREVEGLKRRRQADAELWRTP